MPNPYRLLLFVAVSFAVVGGGHLYLYRRFLRDVGLSLRARRAALAVFSGFAALGLTARFWTPAAPEVLGHAAGAAGRVWLGWAFYLVLAMATLEGVRGLVRWLRRRVSRMVPAPVSPERRIFLAKAMGASAFALGSSTTAFGMFRAYHPPEVTELAIRLPRLPKELDGFTLVQLSDLHVGQSVREKWMEELVQRCTQLRPDVLVLTGDLVDDSVKRLGTLVARLRAIPSRAGAYFVTGNHDYYSGVTAWCDALTKMGFLVLRNARVTVPGGAGPSFDLVGVDDQGQKPQPDGTGYDLSRALRGRDLDRAAVLLAHRPEDFALAASLGVGLQLSGHTHGGQTFPVTELARLVFERRAGLYTEDDARLYVSRGVGFVGPPLRAGSPPEIVRVTLLA